MVSSTFTSFINLTFNPMIFIKTKTSLILACGLALGALPAAFAEQHAGKSPSDAMFKAMDSNRDGKVSRAEHASSAQKMFSEADANRDGRATLAEIETSFTKQHADQGRLQTDKPKLQTDRPMKNDQPMRMGMSAAEMLNQCDQNGDGQVSTAEHVAHADAMFTKLDTDGDSFLSVSECAAGHEAMLKDTKSVKN